MGNKTWGTAGRATRETGKKRKMQEVDKVRGQLAGNGSESAVKERQKISVKQGIKVTEPEKNILRMFL